MIKQRLMSVSVLGEEKTWDAIEWGSINEEIVTAEINKRKNAPTELIDFALDPYDVGIAMGKFKSASSDRIYTALCAKTPYGEVDYLFLSIHFSLQTDARWHGNYDCLPNEIQCDCDDFCLRYVFADGEGIRPCIDCKHLFVMQKKLIV